MGKFGVDTTIQDCLQHPAFYVFIFFTGLFSLLVLFWKPIYGFCYGLMDKYYLRTVFLKFYRQKLCYLGYGNKEMFEKLKNHRFAKLPKLLSKEELKCVKTFTHKETGIKESHFTFLSPMHEFMDKGTENAYFVFFQPKKEKDNKKLISIQVAGGQKFIGWRYRNVGKYFVESGYSVIINVPPTGVGRIPKWHKESSEAKNHRFVFSNRTAIDFPIEVHAMIHETRTMLRYLIEKYGFKKTVITGQSWGAIQSLHIGNYPISKDVDIGLVCMSPLESFFSRKFTRARGLHKNFYQEISPIKSAMKEKDGAKRLYKSVCHLFYPHNFDIFSLKSNVKDIIIMQASNDVLIPSSEKKEASHLARKIAKKNGLKENTILEINFIGGHFTSFQNKRVMNFYRSMIQKSFQRLEN